MRVLLTPRRSDENGAVAILVGVMVMILCVLSAFAVDLGMAFNSKRQLQVAADSGALAAAAVYASAPDASACEQTFIDDHFTAAEDAAQDYRDRNRIDASDLQFDVTCVDGELEVTYQVEGETDTVFGALAGAGESIATDRSAAAVMDVSPSSGSGLRPLAICATTVPGALPSMVVKVGGPSQGSAPDPAGCPEAANGGNWWTIDCPEGNGNNSDSQLRDRVLNGCQDSVFVVPGQPDPSDPGLADYLVDACPVRSPSCLSANPGNFSNQVANAFTQLIEQRRPIILPVFCGTPLCSEEATNDEDGNNVIYPVHRLAAVTICGYRFNNKVAEIDWLDHENIGICHQQDSGLRAATAGVRGENYLLVVFHSVQVSGGTQEYDCELGAECDSGLRRVRLTQ